MAPPFVKGEETSTAVHIERYRKDAIALEEKLASALSLPGEATSEQVVWEVYAGTEKLIAIMKLRLDYETPGAFTKLPEASDPAKLLVDAREMLSKAAGELSARKGVNAIETLRRARNSLRSFLTEKSKSATRRTRSPKAEARGLSD